MMESDVAIAACIAYSAGTPCIGKEGGNNHPAPDSEKPREKARSYTEGYERQKNEERHAVLTQRKYVPQYKNEGREDFESE